MMFRFLFALSSLSILVGCGSDQKTTQPTKGKITESVYASGVVKSKNQYQVFSKSTGILQNILVKKGDPVKVGQIICNIQHNISGTQRENARLAANYAAISENKDRLRELLLAVQMSEKKLLNDSLLMVRQNNLWAQHIGTKVDKEQRTLQYENSKTNYESAVIRYKELKKQIELNAAQSANNLSISSEQVEDYEVRSAVSGRLYAFYKEPGEMVSPQQPLAVIGSADFFYLKLDIDENDIVKIKTGQKVFVSLDSYKGELFEAEVSLINPIMNEKTRSFEIEATFTKQPPVLYPNLTVEANIFIQAKENVLTIPRNYLIDDTYVLISAKEKKKVKVGLTDYQQAEILEGLTEKDKIYMPLP